MSKITFQADKLLNLQHEMTMVGAALSEVANGAYVSGNLFTESRGASVGQMNELCPLLADSATVLYDVCVAISEYFATIIEKMDEWDLQSAIHAELIEHPRPNLGLALAKLVHN